MIAVVQSGVANVKSVLCALRRLRTESVLTAGPADLRAADGVILPGVGAFSAAMENLKRTGLDEELARLVRAGKPVLGICLGLQMLFTESEEHGTHKGLNLLEGRVRRFSPASGGPAGLKVPHIGWNQVVQKDAAPLFEGVPKGSFFYFAHSYYVEPKAADVVAAVTEYGQEFVSAVARGSLFGVQFHPEKSGPVGQKLLENFCRICKGR